MIRRVYFDLARRAAAEGRLLWLAQAGARFGLVRLSALLRRPLCGPILGTIVTTYACNLRCRMCDMPDRAGAARKAGLREFDTAGMRAVIDGFAELGTLGVGFTGGEPLTRPDLWELLAHCRARGILTHLNTNGTLLDEEAVRRLLEARVDSLNISLDGATAETHERIRGLAGSFARTVDAVRLVVRKAREARSPLRVKLVLVFQEENAAEVPEFLALAERLGVACAELIPRQPSRHAAVLPPPADAAFREHAEETVRGLLSRTGGIPLEDSRRMLKLFGPTFRGEPSPLVCYAAWSSLGADCFGRLYACFPYMNWDLPFATLGDPRGLPAAWRARGLGWRGAVSRCRACTLNCQAELNLLLSPLRNVSGP